MARYYLTQRGPSPGAIPMPWDNSVIDIKDYGEKIYVEEIDRKAWGYIEYKYQLSNQDIKDYELIKVEIKKENILPFSDILASDFSLCKDCCNECKAKECPLRK